MNSSANDNSNNRIFIGGIAGGIGSCLARRLLAAGHTVGGFGKAGPHLDQFQQMVPEATVIEADGTDPEAVKAAFAAFVESQGGFDGYVHAIGNVSLKPLHMLRDEEWRSVQAINLDSAFYAAREAVNAFRKQKHGSLVFFSSVAAVTGLANHEAIAAAKGGVSGLVKAISATYASMGIRANAIAPGLVETPATASLTGNEQAKRFSEKMHPLGRLGTPDDIAGLAEWLLGDESGWMTGQILSLDGGMGGIVPKPRA
jgi:NAD(P)-dependent dehydrogenase (short-subunit alcohol dehydrogenase family)